MGKLLSFSRISGVAIGLVFILSACVTINVYFPSAAAEEAAEQIVEDVLGKKDAVSPPAGDKGSHLPGNLPTRFSVVDWLIPAAHAAPNFDVETPAIRQIQARMKARNRDLTPFYNAGAAGFGKDGFVKIRDNSAVGLRDRKKFAKLVDAENADRRALYREIAKANGHPEWEKDVAAVFAKKWREKARKGWWVQDASGAWRKK
jgi:uncharacterized protein YdbL (DUF1318 family)